MTDGWYYDYYDSPIRLGDEVLDSDSEPGVVVGLANGEVLVEWEYSAASWENPASLEVI